MDISLHTSGRQGQETMLNSSTLLIPNWLNESEGKQILRSLTTIQGGCLRSYGKFVLVFFFFWSLFTIFMIEKLKKKLVEIL